MRLTVMAVMNRLDMAQACCDFTPALAQLAGAGCRRALTDADLTRIAPIPPAH